MGVYEFGPRIKAATVLQYGESGDPKSPHYFDQAKLYSETKFKTAWFYKDEVDSHTVTKYHPGRKVLAVRIRPRKTELRPQRSSVATGGVCHNDATRPAR